MENGGAEEGAVPRNPIVVVVVEVMMMMTKGQGDA
jgi:hypothetical protein